MLYFAGSREQKQAVEYGLDKDGKQNCLAEPMTSHKGFKHVEDEEGVNTEALLERT